MTQQKDNQPPNLHLDFPRTPWKLSLACYLFLLLLLSVFYGPHLYSLGMRVLLGAYAVYLGGVLLLLWILPALQGPRSVAITENGLQVDKRIIPWENIESIDHGFKGVWKRIGVRIRVKKSRFLEFQKSSLRASKDAFLPSTPELYREILAQLPRYISRSVFSSSVERALKDPESEGEPKKIFAGFVLSTNAVLLALLFGSHEANLFTILCVGIALFFVSTNAPFYCLSYSSSARGAFLGTCLRIPGIVLPVFGLHMILLPPMAAYETVVAAGFIFTGLGAAMLVIKKELTVRANVIILLIATSGASMSYLYLDAQHWPVRDISHFFAQSDSITLIWGESGKYIAPWYGQQDGTMLEIPSFQTKSLPKHDHSAVIHWLGSRYVIRRVCSNEKEKELWAYDFPRGKSTLLAKSKSLRLAHGTCFQPANAGVVWLEKPEEGNTTLHVRKLNPGEFAMEPQELPESVTWTQAGWAGSNEILVYGGEKRQTSSPDRKKDDDQQRYHVIRMSTEGDLNEEFVTEEKYQCFRAGPDMRYAVASKADDIDEDPLYCIDLKSGSSVRLPLGKGACHFASSATAYRVTADEGQNYLARLELGTGDQKRLHSIRPHLQLVGVNAKTEYAVFTQGEKTLGMPCYRILHLPSGKRRWIRMSGFSPSAVQPLSPISPDGRMLLFTSYSFPSKTWKFRLCEIPPGWPEAE